jgi:hypothetical protein
MDDFTSSVKTPEKHANGVIMKKVCENLIKVMGGEICKGRMVCDFNIFFLEKDVKLMQGPMKKYKDVHFKYITESFFHWIQLDEDDYLVNKS